MGLVCTQGGGGRHVRPQHPNAAARCLLPAQVGGQQLCVSRGRRQVRRGRLLQRGMQAELAGVPHLRALTLARAACRKYLGNGKGEEYGPTFGTGDTVGAGIHRQELFFTCVMIIMRVCCAARCRDRACACTRHALLTPSVLGPGLFACRKNGTKLKMAHRPIKGLVIPPIGLHRYVCAAASSGEIQACGSLAIGVQV